MSFEEELNKLALTVKRSRNKRLKEDFLNFVSYLNVLLNEYVEMGKFINAITSVKQSPETKYERGMIFVRKERD